MTLLNLGLGVLISVIKFPLCLLGLGQLDLNVPQRVLQFLVLYLAQSQHLSVLYFGTFLAFHS